MSIKQIIKKFIPQTILDKKIHLSKQIQNFYTLSHTYGQYQSIVKWSSQDRNQRPIPWYTYPAIEFLSNLDFSNKTILEYGSGNSSLFWADRAKQVISIERDEKWFSSIYAKKRPNQEIYLVDSSISSESKGSFVKNELNNAKNTMMGGGIAKNTKDLNDNSTSKDSSHNIYLKQDSNMENIPLYATFPSTLNMKFDCIIIDGSFRFECAKMAKSLLNIDAKDGYMVILDNSDWMRKTARFLREELNLIEVDFHGFAPINAYTHTTSIFLSRNFAFSAIDGILPHYSLAALHHNEE